MSGLRINGHSVETLPRWARDEFDRMRQRLARLETDLALAMGVAPARSRAVALCDPVLRMEHGAERPLPDAATIVFRPQIATGEGFKDQPSELEVFSTEGPGRAYSEHGVVVRAAYGGGLRVVPLTNNTVVITTEF
jgi:hypothetical protein